MMPPASDQPGGRSGRYAFKVLCPPLLVDKFRANDLKELERIEDQTQSSIRLSYERELYPETRYRIMSIRASESPCLRDAVAALADEVMAKGLEEDGVSGEDFMTTDGQIVLRCVLPAQAMDELRDTHGPDLKKISDDTGASLSIDQEYDGCILVTVAGDRSQLGLVLEDLIVAVERQMQEDWFPAWADQLRVAGPVVFDAPRPSRRRGHDSDEHRGCTIFVGHLSQATTKHNLSDYFGKYGEVLDSDVRVDPESKRSKGFGFITFAEPSSVSDCIRDAKDHHIDGRWVDVKAYEAKPEGGKDGGKGSSKGKGGEKGKGDRGDKGGEKGREKGKKGSGGKGYPSFGKDWAGDRDRWTDYSERDYREAAERERGGSRRDMDRRREEWPATASSRHRSQEPDAKRRRRGDSRHRSPPPPSGSASHHPYLPPARPSESSGGDVQWLARLLSEVKPEYAGLQYSISCFLPSKKCGPLIGHGGSNVTEVQRRTGAQVDISKQSAPDTPDSREVRITGSLLTVYAAHGLLMQVYNEEEAMFEARNQSHRDRDRDSGRDQRNGNANSYHSYQGGSNGRDHYTSSSSSGWTGSSHEKPSVEDLKRQMDEIQQKLENVSTEKDRHGYPSSRHDGYDQNSFHREYSSGAGQKGKGGGKGKRSSDSHSKGGKGRW